MTHAVVDVAAAIDYMRLIAKLRRLEVEIIGVDAYAVSAHKSGRVAHEVPFGCGCVEHVVSADVHPRQNDRHLVHQRHVDITLRVLHNLGCLGHLNRRRPIDPGFDDRRVDLRHVLQHFGAAAGHHLDHAPDRVPGVAGIDALGTVADPEVDVHLHARFALDNRHAFAQRAARVDRALEDHRGASAQMPPDGCRRLI